MAAVSRSPLRSASDVTPTGPRFTSVGVEPPHWLNDCTLERGLAQVTLGVAKPEPSERDSTSEAVTQEEGSAAGKSNEEVDEMWQTIREEAKKDSEAEPALGSYLFSAIITHRTFEAALASHLANKLASPTLPASQLQTLFLEVLRKDAAVGAAAKKDMRTVRERDPACSSFLHCLLNFKGFQALQVHRIAHALWAQGRHSLALALQQRVSEVFNMDIHPGAKFGTGVLLDHGTGIIVGETAEVGDDVIILHNVNLGSADGTPQKGRRHPKIESGAVIGTGARVLGPVTVGAKAKIGAGSVVLQDVSPGATAVGSPAKEVRKKVALGAMGYVIDYEI